MRKWQDKIVQNIGAWRKQRDELIGAEVVIFTNGCFDLIHHGHVELLQTARLLREKAVLIVGVNSDESVRTLKGPSRPVADEQQRLAVIAALEAVDYCLIFNGTRCDHIIRAVRPDIWVKGGDYTLASLDADERKAAHEVKTQIEIIPFKHGISTTQLISRSKTAAAR